MNISRELIVGQAPGDSHAWFVVEGNPEIGYTLFRVYPEKVQTFKRKWEAVSHAKNGASTDRMPG